jgi:hypothetical protein
VGCLLELLYPRLGGGGLNFMFTFNEVCCPLIGWVIFMDVLLLVLISLMD